jgi:hypothetical protein
MTDEEARLVERIIALATQYGRYGYPENHSRVKTERVASESQESREDLEEGRTESPEETTEETETMA